MILSTSTIWPDHHKHCAFQNVFLLFRLELKECDNISRTGRKLNVDLSVFPKNSSTVLANSRGGEINVFTMNVSVFHCFGNAKIVKNVFNYVNQCRFIACIQVGVFSPR